MFLFVNVTLRFILLMLLIAYTIMLEPSRQPIHNPLRLMLLMVVSLFVWCWLFVVCCLLFGVCWLVGWFGWSVGWSVCRSVGQSVGWLHVRFLLSIISLFLVFVSFVLFLPFLVRYPFLFVSLLLLVVVKWAPRRGATIAELTSRCVVGRPRKATNV